jgi:hypothetical protein
MPNAAHEVLHHVFRDDTSLFSRTLKLLEIDFPLQRTVAVGNGDMTEPRGVLNRYADTVLRAETEDGPFVIIIEIQNQRDDRKLRNWAYYPTYAHERHDGCPVVLIVLCRDLKTAAWAREPYRIGLPGRPTLTSTPIVFGPDNLPRMTDPAQVVEDPQLALMCAIVFAHDAQIGAILEAIATALPQLNDPVTAKGLLDSLERGLADTPDTLETWKKTVAHVPMVMKYRSQLAMDSEARGEAKGEAKGKVKAKAEDVLRILERRGILVHDDIRERIATCKDLDLLNTWFDEAITATTITQLTGFSGS